MKQCSCHFCAIAGDIANQIPCLFPLLTVDIQREVAELWKGRRRFGEQTSGVTCARHASSGRQQMMLKRGAEGRAGQT